MCDLHLEENYLRLYCYLSLLVSAALLRISHIHVRRRELRLQQRSTKQFTLFSVKSGDGGSNPVDEMVAHLKKVLRSNGSQENVDLFKGMVLENLRELNKPDTKRGKTILMYATLAKQNTLISFLNKNGAQLTEGEKEMLSAMKHQQAPRAF